MNALVNTKECWGQRPVDQSTPWDVSGLVSEDPNGGAAQGSYAQSVSQSSTGLLGDAVSLALNQRRGIKGTGGNISSKPGSTVESNVWPSEPPTGTGIWEMHYENLGERTARWKQTGSTTTTASTASTARIISGVSSPPGSHRSSASAFMPPPSNPPPPQSLQAAATSQQRQFPPNFFSQQQQQQRFGPSSSSGFPQPPGAGRGPNGMLGATGGFRPLHSAAPGSNTGWPLPLTPDSPSKSFSLLIEFPKG